MTRHGVRSPLSGYPDDVGKWDCQKRHKYSFSPSKFPGRGLQLIFDVKNVNPGSCAGGQIADVGYEQHVELGKLWKILYPHLYTNESLRTTMVERVRLSLNGQMEQQEAQVNLAHVATKYLDSSTIPDNCTYMSPYIANTRTLIDYHDAELKDLQQRSGWTTNWEGFADNFRAREAMGVVFPEEVTAYDRETANQIMDEIWRLRYCTNPHPAAFRHYMKVSIGAYLPDLLEKLEKTPFSIMSGHDTSIAPLVALLVDGIACGQPGYASALMVERWEINGENKVKIRFRDGPDGEGEYKVIKACGETVCSWGEFESYLRPFFITIDERTEMCNDAFVPE